MNNKVETVPMNEENYLLAAELEKACFDDRPWTAEQFHDELSLDFSRTFIAFDGGEAAGFVNMWLTPPMAIINNIAVAKNHRRRGIASLLIDRALGECGGCSSLTLEVRVSNTAAISLYEKLGFSQVGRRKNFYENPREDAFIMTKFMKKDCEND
jgi:ribosomal-protein-alanine N-acetyltransferase